MKRIKSLFISANYISDGVVGIIIVVLVIATIVSITYQIISNC